MYFSHEMQTIYKLKKQGGRRMEERERERERWIGG
jgi:hypothetical protein